ncbi:hypothetical protein TNCT_331691 [Trichonephila clavata]|uniref:Secreted protein n=1 Tax=Trichonephila clavata TaxID=2740835 RepID=A0A8X6J6F8_TRICU|nr:hypothetical protein TNCT_331691 [Trichonephila clavata]
MSFVALMRKVLLLRNHLLGHVLGETFNPCYLRPAHGQHDEPHHCPGEDADGVSIPQAFLFGHVVGRNGADKVQDVAKSENVSDERDERHGFLEVRAYLPRHCEQHQGLCDFLPRKVIQKRQAHGHQMSQECLHVGQVHEAEKSHNKSRKHEEVDHVHYLVHRKSKNSRCVQTTFCTILVDKL